MRDKGLCFKKTTSRAAGKNGCLAAKTFHEAASSSTGSCKCQIHRPSHLDPNFAQRAVCPAKEVSLK